MNIQENLTKVQRQFEKAKISSAGLDAEVLLLEAIRQLQNSQHCHSELVSESVKKIPLTPFKKGENQIPKQVRDDRFVVRDDRTKRRRHNVVSPSEKKDVSEQKNKDINKTWLYAHSEYELNENQQKKFENFIKRRLKGEPIAYIISRKEFFGLDFYVDKRVMIPRPETEIIVEEIIKKINAFNHCHSELVSESVKKIPLTSFKKGENQIPKQVRDDRFVVRDDRRRHSRMSPSTEEKFCYHHFNIIDIGTGSGCVAIALAKNIFQRRRRYGSSLSYIKFYAIDISKEAIEVAKINAKKNKIFPRIKFLKGNLLKPIQKLEIKNHPTIIIANLPYLKIKDIKKNIGLTYEPISALDGGEDGPARSATGVAGGLEKIKELIVQIKKINFNIFECWLEINPEQANTLIRFVKKNLNGIKIKMVKDLSRQNRFLKINKN